MSQVAYALRADFEASFVGGVLNVADRDFDVAKQLSDGHGFVLVNTDDQHATLLTAVLDEYPALKRVPVTHAQQARAKATRRPAKADVKTDARKEA